MFGYEEQRVTSRPRRKLNVVDPLSGILLYTKVKVCRVLQESKHRSDFKRSKAFVFTRGMCKTRESAHGRLREHLETQSGMLEQFH